MVDSHYTLHGDILQTVKYWTLLIKKHGGQIPDFFEQSAASVIFGTNDVLPKREHTTERSLINRAKYQI